MRELNQYPSRVIARVRAGETIDVTDRGRVVARLTPVAPADSLLEDLVRAGLATPASITRPFDEPRPAADSSVSLADEVTRQRDDG